MYVAMIKIITVTKRCLLPKHIEKLQNLLGEGIKIRECTSVSQHNTVKQGSCYVCKRIDVFSTFQVLCCSIGLLNVIAYSKLNAYINFEITSAATGVRERVTRLERNSSVIFMLHTISCMIKRLQ
jgi:hypothetical protein